MINKGFTLIELLAVIVILAIIALIVAPTVLNLIDNSEENAGKRSAEMYLKAVDLAIANARLDGIKVKEGQFGIIEGGNICLVDESPCPIDKILEVKTTGDAPNSGTVYVSGSSVYDVDLYFKDGTHIEIDDDGELVYADPNNNSDNNDDNNNNDDNENVFVPEYAIGEEITFNPGDGDKKWYVIGEDETTVTLLMEENADFVSAWISETDYGTINGNTDDYGDGNSINGNTKYGPYTALTTLNSLTQNWTAVDNIASYEYQNNLNGTTYTYGYQKLTINNGTAKLLSLDGTKEITVTGNSKARFLSMEEYNELLLKSNDETAMRTYINNNITGVETLFSDFCSQMQISDCPSTIDDVDDALLGIEKILVAQGENLRDYNILVFGIEQINNNGAQLEITTTYELNKPTWLYSSTHYWTLSTRHNSGYRALGISQTSYSGISGNSNLILRPVITISKDKIQ